MDLEPLSVLLKFGFLAVLYLTLFWVARSALRDLRRGVSTTPMSETGINPVVSSDAGTLAPPEAYLEVVRGGGLQPEERIDLFGGVTLGRSGEADVTLSDDFASGIHARVYPRRGAYWLEDLGSTNGTFLNMEPVNGELRLTPDDRIRIGDTELRYLA